MKSGRIKNLKKNVIITFCMLLALSCCSFAEENPSTVFKLIDTPAQYNDAEDYLSQTIPPELPMPIIINSFFAPIDEVPQDNLPIVEETVPATEKENVNDLRPKATFKDLSVFGETPQLREKEVLAQKEGNINLRPKAKFEDLSVIEENPFKIMDKIKLPSEYKSADTPFREIKNGSSASDNAEYVTSAREEHNAYENNYEGTTVSQVIFKGLECVNRDMLMNLIQTGIGSRFYYGNVQNDLQNIYATGYFKDNMYVEPESDKNGQIILTFVLEENMKITQTEIKGNSVIKNSELIKFTEKMKGLPENVNLINEAVENINKQYESKGYILAKVTDVDDREKGKLVFTISEGIVEEVNFEGNEKTKDYVIRRNILTKPGSVYNEELIKKDLAKVYSTQIFDEVDREISPSPNKEGAYIVTVKVKEGSSNNVNIGLGIDSALGGFGSVSYNEKNLFGRNQKLSLSGMLGTGLLLSDASIKNRMNWNLELNFFEPHFLNEDNSFASKLYYRDLGSYQIPLAIEKRWGINNTIEHKVIGYDNLTTSLALGYENIHLKEGDLIKISDIYRKRNIDLAQRSNQLKGGSYLNLAPGIKFSTLDDEINPREGLIAKTNFVESVGLSSPNRTNGRLMGSITKYIPIAEKSTLLIGAKGGVKVHGNHMPEVMAFRLGGPYTIRGFRMNGVGTGEGFIMASTELQTPIPLMDKLKYDFFKNLRFAFFVDAGKVYDPTITSTLYDRPLSAITMGVGLRINIPGMSTITFDYGIPLTNTGHCSSQHGYFTFGTGGLYDSY